jgi:hypothetical protein
MVVGEGTLMVRDHPRRRTERPPIAFVILAALAFLVGGIVVFAPLDLVIAVDVVGENRFPLWVVKLVGVVWAVASILVILVSVRGKRRL